MAKSDFTLAFNEITETHHLPRDIVIDALRQALVSAYRRDAGIGTAQRIEAEVDPATTRYKIFVEKEVVEDVIEPKTEITYDEAIQFQPNAQLGDTIMALVEINSKDFGRIAAQTAKQVILQKIREAERKSLYDEFKDREGDLVTGNVQSVNAQNITLTLGRAEAVMPAGQQIKGERYRPHDKIRTYVLEVKETSRGPQIVVSRAHKNMLRRLLEYEVPEIYNGQVEIKSIAREAGHRSKVAVSAQQPGIDPVGACVGMRGVRIQNIVKELNEEKIDVIEWSPDPSVFIAKALSPARVTGVYLEKDIDQGDTATVIVPDDQLSLAIGREGQNARLAAKLTGWRIDIKSVSEAAQDALNNLSGSPLSKIADDHADMVVEAQRILEKKRADRAVTPEEYTTLARFVQLAEQRLLEYRETNRVKRRKALDKVKAAVPAQAFAMELEELELERDINQALKNRNINNVGDLMVRLLAEEDMLRSLLAASNAGEDAMEAIQAAIESLVLDVPAAKPDPVAPNPATEEVPAVEDQPAETLAAMPEVEAVEDEFESEGDEEDAPPAFVDEERPTATPQKKPQVKFVPKPQLAQQTNKVEPIDYRKPASSKKKGGKAKEKQREIFFDEEAGAMRAKRKRKGNRGGEWEGGSEE